MVTLAPARSPFSDVTGYVHGPEARGNASSTRSTRSSRPLPSNFSVRDSISDRAVDFSAAFYWGGDRLVEAVSREYGESLRPAELARARYWAACRGVADVKFGRETGKPEYVSAGIRALSQIVP